MFADGFRDILNVDYSEIVIEKMKSRYSSLTGLDWKVMDITDLSTLSRESFDVVLEKGTLDALLVAEKDPWSLSPEAENLIDTILMQVSRLLKPGGRFVSVTFAQPHFRLPFYARPRYGWNTSTQMIGGTGFHYFFYVMTKGTDLSEDDRKIRESYLERKNVKRSVVFVSDSEDEDFLLKGMNLDDSVE